MWTFEAVLVIFLVLIGFVCLGWALYQTFKAAALKADCARLTARVERERDSGLTVILAHIFRPYDTVVFGPVASYGLTLFEDGDKDTTVDVAIVVSLRQLKRWLLHAHGLSVPPRRINMARVEQLYGKIMQNRVTRAQAAEKVLMLDLGLMRAISPRGEEMLDIYLVPPGLLGNEDLDVFWDSLRGEILDQDHDDLQYLR